MNDVAPIVPQKSKAQELADMGRERLNAKDKQNAVALLSAAIDEDPNCFDAVLNLGVTIGGMGNWATGAAFMRKAIAIGSDNVQHVSSAWANLGLYLTQVQEYAAAEFALRTALRLDSSYGAAHHNFGLLRFYQSKPQEAAKELEVAIKLYEQEGAKTLGARSDLSLSVLKTGQLHKGLVLNEVRWEGMISKGPAWDLGLPKWAGESIKGKTIFVHSEQGFGDAIQFIRFIPELKKRGAYVIFGVPRPLIRLLDGQCGCDEVINYEELSSLLKAARKSDYHSPLLSVVCLIGAEFDGQPAEAAPYLRPVVSVSSPTAPAGRRAKLVRSKGFRVGLVWAASPGYQRSRERSIPVEDLLALGEVKGVRLFSLQVGPYKDDLKRIGADKFVVDLADEIEDFADTVEFARQLDLVVSVDTGPFHAVAASGVKTWLVQPLWQCWRWSHGVKIWYGCADDYSQKVAGSWKAPIVAMKRDLERLVNGK
jgi:tetratricopeptide (TPR) repeat protein